MTVPRLGRWIPPACSAVVLVLAAHLPVMSQQTGSVVGVVRGAEGTPISGAQIYIEGMNLGNLANEDGRFLILNVPVGSYTVVAEFLGYAEGRQENVIVLAGQPTLVDFQMRTQVLSMSELVVTGVAQATSRTMIPFTVSRVGKADIPVPPKNAMAAIQGKVAGVNLIKSPEPGGGVNVLLRTPTSIYRETSPLMVVDGVILSSSSADLSTLDIESVEVVKGAAAASLYGSRAASGVINIRTTRGSSLATGRTRFTVRSEYGASDIPLPIAWAQYHNFQMNSQGQFLDDNGQVVSRALAATTQYGFMDQKYPGVTYDHINSLFNPGDYFNNSATFGYNSGETSWLATISNQHEYGVVRGNDGSKRTDFRVNLDHRPRSDLSMSVSLFHMRSTTEGMYGNVFFDFIQQAPDVDLLQPDPDGTKYIFQPDEAGIRANPLYMVATQERLSKRQRTMGNAQLRYTPVAWLSLDLDGSYDLSNRPSSVWIPKGVKTPDYPNGNPGYTSRSEGMDDAVNASVGANVSRDFGLLRTHASARALIERENAESFSASGDELGVGGVPDLDAAKIPSIGSSESAVRSTGYFVTTDVDWDERYIFSGLVRRDGSSLFGSNERWATYYRTSFAYRMTQESWWPFEQINEFKVRYSRGTAGGRPSFADQYEVFSILSGGGLSLATLGNKNLKPEYSTEQEFGIDLVAFERLSLQLSYATQRTEDELLAVPLPDLFGFSSQWQNAGTIEGHTYEGTLEARVMERGNFRWTMTFVGDRSRNKILEYDRPCHFSGIGWRCAGEQIGNAYTEHLLRGSAELADHRGGLHANSLDQFQVNDMGLLVAVGAGNSWQDGVTKGLWGTKVNIDGINYDWGYPVRLADAAGNDAVVKTGDFNPDFKWGYSNQVQWGPFSVYALVDGQVGGDVYNATKQRMYQWLRHGDEDQVGKPENLKKPASYYVAALYNNNDEIDWFMEDASYVKLREIALRYRLEPSRFASLARLPMESVAFTLTGRNLFTWTDYSGYDPEIGSPMSRIDSFDYPIYRTFTLSVEITF
ncbi:MAG: SusC/RagA family TonB-linked outer membrane protein [Longimicrobiales bacterium]|nr:SusC/RagA family TonB-linked outer membrane protein [Longimicrobiales bacterium]